MRSPAQTLRMGPFFFDQNTPKNDQKPLKIDTAPILGSKMARSHPLLQVSEVDTCGGLQTRDPFAQDPPLTLADLDFSAISVGDDKHVSAAHIRANLFHTLQIYKC